MSARPTASITTQMSATLAPPSLSGIWPKIARAATKEIAGNVQQAADGTRHVSENIHSVTRASNEAHTATSRLLDAANGLSSQSSRLKSEVDGFLGSLRVA